MEHIVQLATPWGVLAMCLFIIWQLIDRFVLQKPLSARLSKIETNHLVHMEEDLRRIEAKVDKVIDVTIGYGNRLTRIETKIDI